MKHPFSALRAEYEHMLASMVVTRPAFVDEVAHRLVGYKPRYGPVAAKTGVPIVWLAAINERESSSNFRTYLGNGEPLGRRTRLVPRGRGPFGSWEAGAIDALHVDGIDAVKDWSWPRALFEAERWNGFGPRNHRIHTGYLWAGTNHYDRGKYVADGVWDPNHRDTQLGIVPIMRRMVELDASLQLGLAAE
jgi:lysozyme family protein